MDKVSYALGLSIGNNFKSSGIDSVVMDDFMQGLSDVLEEKAPQLSYDEAKREIEAYFMDLQQKAVKLNKEAGEEFLKINAHKEGVTTLPSGLQYEVIKMGEGPKPTLSDTVTLA